MNLRNKLIRFMNGRYGVDDLYKLLFLLYIITFILNIFLSSMILEIIGLLIVLFTFYRVFSKNIYKRSRENREYLKLKRKIIKPFSDTKRYMLDKDHIYRKCSKCGVILKLPLPNKRGINHANCPKCKKRLTLLVFKKQKIEIIKNKK